MRAVTSRTMLIRITNCQLCGEEVTDPHTFDTCPKYDDDHEAGVGAPFIIDADDLHDNRKLKPLTQVGPKQNGDLQEFEEEKKK